MGNIYDFRNLLRGHDYPRLLLLPWDCWKSLEEIDDVFESKTPAWRTGQTGTFQDRLHEVDEKLKHEYAKIEQKIVAHNDNLKIAFRSLGFDQKAA